MTDSKINKIDRRKRSFIIKILWWLSALIGTLITIPIVSALFEPLIKIKGSGWRQVGRVDDFVIGETKLVKFRNAEPLPWSDLSSQTASWLRRNSENSFTAFSINCTHLGCPVRWLPDAELFLCPCHGGVYNKDGSYSAGPPPKGLTKYAVRIKNNAVEINTAPIPITETLKMSS